MQSDLSHFVFNSHYAQPSSVGLESWQDATERVLAMHRDKYACWDLEDVLTEVRPLLLSKTVLGSQRALQFGGPSILRKNARIYNCAACYVDRPLVFSDSMWLLLCGVGVGFSVQLHHVAKLPSLWREEDFEEEEELTFVVEDTIEGWSDAVAVLLSCYFKTDQKFPEYNRRHVNFDVSQIRAKGSSISNITGKAPGPKPLVTLIAKIRTLLATCPRRLRPIDAFDLLMYIADSVLAGGVRRSACLTIFSKEDSLMMNAKTGSWYVDHPERGRSNNSVLCLRQELSSLADAFQAMREFGEPGVILADSREALFNPCVEVGLRGYDDAGQSGFQMCNLTEINVKATKDKETFWRACRAAALLGTLQAGYTDFAYLGPVTEAIVRRESLLGVSMTGILENWEMLQEPGVLARGAEIVKETNRALATRLGIPWAARTTCVKPAGSTSVLCGTSSGIHPHHARRYLRRVQVNRGDPTLPLIAESNPLCVEASKWGQEDDCVSFCCEVSDKAMLRKDFTDPVDHLKIIAFVQREWVLPGKDPSLCVVPWLCHNVSNTVTIPPDAWDRTERFVVQNKHSFAGLAFLGSSGDIEYPQAPFQEILTAKEIVRRFGQGSLFVSGLIVHGREAFQKDIFSACNFLKSDVQSLTEDSRKNQQLVWKQRAIKFCEDYYQGDLAKMIACIKHVDALHLWSKIHQKYQQIPWHLVTLEHKQEKKTTDLPMACVGGACEITRV